MIVRLEIDINVIKLILAHLPEEVGEDDQCQEGEQGREGVLEQVRADCVRRDLISLLEGVKGNKGDESDWCADDANESQVRGAPAEQRGKLLHVLSRGQEVRVDRTDQLKGRYHNHVPAAVAPKIID